MMRVILIDDEPLARARMRHVLSGDPRVEVVGECRDTEEARVAIEALDPDALFLDIEMPRGNGLELARQLEEDGGPLVVFVTAHPRYAYDAFDVAPVDYVLKPVDPVRCRRAVRRLARILDARRGEPSIASDSSAYLDRIFVKENARLVHLPVRDIESIEALGNYVKLRARGRTFVVRATLSSLEGRLNPAQFARIHRSYMVNIGRVSELLPQSHGDYTVVVESGQTIPLSRVYRSRLPTFVLSSDTNAKRMASAHAV